MIRASLLLLALGPLGSGHAFAAEELVNSLDARLSTRSEHREWSGDYQLELGGESFREARDEGVAAAFRIKGRFNVTFAPWLKARVEPRLVMFSSRLQSRYNDDQYESSLRAKNAYLSARPVRHLEVRAGALGQDFIEDPMLVSRTRAFPGLQQLATFEPVAGVRTQVVLQQTVPTSTSLNPERNGKESLPIFQTQSVHVRGRHVPGFDYDARVGHYSWTRLPDKIAFESAIMGNSVPNGEAAAGSRFLYGFGGLFWGGSATIGRGRVLGQIEYQGIHNARANSDSADAQSWTIGPKFYWRDQIVSFGYGRHFIESDATVARYNSASLGHTNRLGQHAEIKWAFTGQHFAIRGEWYDSRAIIPQNTQNNLSAFSLGVETDYASF